MKVYPTSGECPICGVKLAPVLIDWTSDESPTGLSGGWRWVCSICESPKHQTEWAADVRKTRIDRRVQIRDLADQIGATSAGLCDIETGRSLPTDDQRSALDSWLAGSEAER